VQFGTVIALTANLTITSPRVKGVNVKLLRSLTDVYGKFWNKWVPTYCKILAQHFLGSERNSKLQLDFPVFRTKI
jgi:hypothetical protein